MELQRVTPLGLVIGVTFGGTCLPGKTRQRKNKGNNKQSFHATDTGSDGEEIQ